MRILLVRHAHCKKNISEIIGGPGSHLTEGGILQARELADKLLGCNSEIRIYSSDVEQAKVTAEIVATRLQNGVTISPLLVPLHLGELAGVASDEAKVKFPTSFSSLQAWNAGQIGTSELRIHGMESFAEFYSRGVSFLRQLDYSEDVAIFSTRSMLILLANIIMGNHYTSKLYQAFQFQHCLPVEFNYEIDPRDS